MAVRDGRSASVDALEVGNQLELGEEGEERCAVCLGDFVDRAVVDACFHAFCFNCISRWAAVSNACPLCKTEFRSALHNIASNTDYNVATFSPAQPARARTDTAGPASTSRGRDPRGARHPRRPPTAAPWGQAVYTEVRASSRAATTLELRRRVYSERLERKPVPLGQFKPRDVSAAAFSPRHQGCRRVLPWLKRELFVLIGANQHHLDFVLQLVCALLGKVGLADRGVLRAELEPFLSLNTDRFLSELTSFARCPFDLVCYDQLVSYISSDAACKADAEERRQGGQGTQRAKRRFAHEDGARQRTARLRTQVAASNTTTGGFRAAMLGTLHRPVPPAPERHSTEVPLIGERSTHAPRQAPARQTGPEVDAEGVRTPSAASGQFPPSDHLPPSKKRAVLTRGNGLAEELRCRLSVVDRQLDEARKKLAAIRQQRQARPQT